MDPRIDKPPALDLPRPNSAQEFFEYGGAEAGPDTDRTMQPEIIAIPPPLSSSTAVSTATLPSSSTAVLPQTNDLIATASAVSNVNDQGDDLDAEWISKAKVIVEKTRDNPFLQTKEISKVKANYLQIRHNKHIKVAEDRT